MFLGHEVTQQLDSEKHGSYFEGIQSTDGYALVFQMNFLVNRESGDRITALHRLFEYPSAVTRKVDVVTKLLKWRRDLKELVDAKGGLKMKDGWRKCYISRSYKEFRVPEMDDIVGCTESPRISSGSKRHIMHREDNNFSMPRCDTEGYVSMQS